MFDEHTKGELLITSKIFGEIFSYLLDITKNDICAKNFYIEDSYGDSICSRATFYSWKNGKYVPKNISTIEQVCKLFADKIESSKIYTLKNYVLKFSNLKFSEFEKDRILTTQNLYEIIFMIFEKIKLNDELNSKKDTLKKISCEESITHNNDQRASWELF